jgi:hypothetical protein
MGPGSLCAIAHWAGTTKNQYFSSFDPASAPIAVISAVESVYQVATNSGESSVQCEA